MTAMSRIYLNWQEASGGDLPPVCATCGDNATEWMERKVSTTRPGFFCIIRRWTTVTLPFCPRHRVASWNGFMRVVARSIGRDGVTLGQVAPGFVDAVEYHRRQRERQRRGLPVVLQPVPVARLYDDEDDELDEDSGEFERPPRRRVTSDSSRAWYAIAMVLIITVVVSFCGFGLLAVNLMRNRPAYGPQQPGFQQPGFGPPVQPVVPKPPWKKPFGQ
jgi:hypothetical protein